MTPTTIAITILAVAAVLVVVALIASASRNRRAIEDVPPGMRPAYSDDELERTVLERYMTWGLVLTGFFAVFFPVYWYSEWRRLPVEQDQFLVESYVRGEDEYQLLCAQCHGANAAGGQAPAPAGMEGTWPAPNLTDIAARYEDNPNIVDIEDFLWTTIERGRPGTPMPTFGQAYAGPLTDQQIGDIVTFLLQNQVDAEGEAPDGEPAEPPEDEDAAEQPADGEEPAEGEEVGMAVDMTGEDLFVANCMKCHGAELEGGAAPTLVGVFQRHEPETVAQIIRDGIFVPTGTIMPPWQNGYMYPDSQLDDEAINSIVAYLEEAQPEDPEAVETEEEGVVAPEADEAPADDGEEEGE